MLLKMRLVPPFPGTATLISTTGSKKSCRTKVKLKALKPDLTQKSNVLYYYNEQYQICLFSLFGFVS